MTVLSDLPTELVLHIVSLLIREAIPDPKHRLYMSRFSSRVPQLIPDLPSINALSRTSTVFHHTLNQRLYCLCASVDPLGKLALLFAVENQLESAVDKLFLAGISPDFECNQCNGSSLLQIAADLGLRAMAVKLLAMYGEKMMDKVLVPDGKSRTPLYSAASNGHVEIVKLLAPIPRSGLRNDPPAEIQQQYLGEALQASARAGELEICQYLIMEGADITFFRDGSGDFPPLFGAAGVGNLELVQFLLASGADQNLKSQHRSTPIFHAANLDVAQALVAAGADIHTTDAMSQNVLYIENIEFLRFFLERGVDSNVHDSIGNTPLHFACSVYNPDNAKALVELLLQFGVATVEKANRDGHTQ
jgi:ankyrin repeat protein